jgi:hypothetical protein
MEARIHLEEPAPPHCAACHQAVPDKRHVDFGASFDGPMLPALDGTVGVVGHSIDEVIICETCITDAGALIGLGDAEALLAEIERLNAANDALHAQLGAQRANVTEALNTLTAHVADPGLPHLVNGSLPLATAPVQPKRKTRAGGKAAK